MNIFLCTTFMLLNTFYISVHLSYHIPLDFTGRWISYQVMNCTFGTLAVAVLSLALCLIVLFYLQMSLECWQPPRWSVNRGSALLLPGVRAAFWDSSGVLLVPVTSSS